MQDLLLHLLTENEAVAHRVYGLVHALNAYREADAALKVIAGQVRSILGDQLYDAYVAAFLRVGVYENRAYYAVGLGLRQEMAKLWPER